VALCASLTDVMCCSRPLAVMTYVFYQALQHIQCTGGILSGTWLSPKHEDDCEMKQFTPQVDIVDMWQGVVIGGKERVIYIGGEGGGE